MTPFASNSGIWYASEKTETPVPQLLGVPRKEFRMRSTRKKRTYIFTIFALQFAFFGMSNDSNFQGKWNTNLGTMTIYQNGNSVTGTYDGSSGKITGMVEGNTLRGSYTWQTKKGTFSLVLSDGGNAFKGEWSRPGASGHWNGTRAKQADSSSSAPSSAAVEIGQVALNGGWRVEDAANGKNGDYAAVPWVFNSSGTVNAKGAWRGLWEPCGGDRIRVVLIDTHANVDIFEIAFFNQGREFVAYKNGRDYRYGIKQ